jgi:hypothetical protein
MAKTDVVGESTKVRKAPQRRALSHLPATCHAALEVLNDVAWELVVENDITENTQDRIMRCIKQARKILRDGLAVVEPQGE